MVARRRGAAEVGVNRNTVMLCERQFREGSLDAAPVDAADRGASTSGHSRGEWGQDVSACAHGAPCVCKVGHETGRVAPLLSVCAHGTLWRVQSRTRDRQNGTVNVRLCTRDDRACAKSDTRLVVSHR